MHRSMTVSGTLAGLVLLLFALPGCGDDAASGPSNGLVADVVAALRQPPPGDVRHMRPAQLRARHCAQVVGKIDEALNRHSDAPEDVVREVREIRDLYARAAELHESADRGARGGAEAAWQQGNGLMQQARQRIEALPGAAPPAADE